MPTGAKQVKGGNETAEFAKVEMHIRGTTYVVRDLGLDEYKECLAAAEKMSNTGFYRYSDLLDMMVLKAVSPSIAARSKPLPFPIYRMLQAQVERMHFEDIAEDEPSEEPAGEASGDPEPPNS